MNHYILMSTGSEVSAAELASKVLGTFSGVAGVKPKLKQTKEIKYYTPTGPTKPQNRWQSLATDNA